MNPLADSVRDPESWPSAFTKGLDAGDIDEMLALYEPEARMLAPPRGELVAGQAGIRSVLAGLIRSRPQLQSRVASCVVVGDVAVLYTDFHGSLDDASGARRGLEQHAIEVLRRQPDGCWKLVFGDPMGRSVGA